MAPSPTRRLPVLRLTVLCLTLAFVPALRSCGGLSFGFPAVAYATLPKDAAHLRPGNALLDLAAVALLAAGLLALYRTRRSERGRALVRGGVQGLAAYQALVVVGYAVLYPIATVHQGDDALTGFILGYAYFIHPYMAAIPRLAAALPHAWHASWLFGDDHDLPMRLAYVVMWAAWFGLGALRVAFRRTAAPAPGALGT
jgi:hypothetical protein